MFNFQLAVLATYVGDEFLALYHCIRSLAVKDPFPDAWNNLILLFERVRLQLMFQLSFSLTLSCINAITNRLLCCHIFFFGSSQLILWFSRTGHLIYITFLVRPALISYNHLKVASGLKHNPLMIF